MGAPVLGKCESPTTKTTYLLLALSRPERGIQQVVYIKHIGMRQRER